MMADADITIAARNRTKLAWVSSSFAMVVTLGFSQGDADDQSVATDVGFREMNKRSPGINW